MNRQGGVVAVDVGNSAIKLCVEDAERRFSQHAIALSQTDWTDAAIAWAQRQFGDSPVQWRIASVHRIAADQLHQAIRALGRNASICPVSWRQIPIAIQVEQPERVGIDRLLGAWGASAEFTGPVTVVDVGSAITIDWVDRQRGFLGGAILPGLDMQTRSLAAGTDALPRIPWNRQSRLSVPGRNTLDAIRLGVLAGAAGAIDRIISLYAESETLESDLQVVLTGGAAPAIAPHLRHRHVDRPHLVCRGLLDLPPDLFRQTQN